MAIDAITPDLADLLSWSVGVAFGRFDLRLATGERDLPPEPDPFDPLPARSPGMRPDDALIKPILVDDPGHPDDLTTAINAILDQVGFPMAASDLRNWLARPFFAGHLPRYSKSQRKAPLYWPLAPPSGRYTLWLYYPALTRDTFYRVLQDYVTPKIQYEERQLADLTQRAGGSPTPSLRKDLAAQETFVTELRTFRDDITRIAPLWNPNLNDGVIINSAPLWRLIPQHKAWQKECRACWNQLAAGDDDWAHWAMHLWPERVVAKCAEDRSLAIAHGLEDVLWEKNASGKAQPRDLEPATLTALIAERTSPAVQDALQTLLDLPAAPAARPSRKKTTQPPVDSAEPRPTRGRRKAKQQSDLAFTGQTPQPDHPSP
ncbi:MAG: hypothetical protein QG599_1865 [Pseudomonadota bacterium]|nr:hypothetical protein [Pseudomonadota bacterium]